MGKNYDLEKIADNNGVETPRLFPSSRGALSLVGFFATIILYLLRFNMSIAIVCMTIDEEVNDTETTGNESRYLSTNDFNSKWSNNHMWVYDAKAWDSRRADMRNNDDACPGEPSDDEGYEETGEFYWDRDLRGTINSSFFWGYVLTQVIGGIIAIKWGAKWVLGGGLIVSIICTFLSPPAARLSPYALMLCRFINGLGSGVFFPCFHHLWALWAPPKEISRLYTFQTAGISWGSVISFALSGVICQEIGWEWVFYMYGIWGAVFMPFWGFFAYNSPATHPRISKEEREYIENSMDDSDAQDEPLIEMPWLKIMLSPPMLFMYIAQFCAAWGSYTNLTSMPQYMEDVLKFDIAKNGFYSSLPHLFKWLFSLIFGWIADTLISNGILSVVSTRRLIQTIAMLPAAAFSIIVGYLDCYSTGWVIFCLICAEAFTAGSNAALYVSSLDMAPRYAGILMGIGNTIANFSGILAPIAVASLTPDGTQEQWRQVFFLSAIMYTVGWLGYVITVKGEVLPWAMPPETDLTTEMEVNKTNGNVSNDIHDDAPHTTKTTPNQNIKYAQQSNFTYKNEAFDKTEWK